MSTWADRVKDEARTRWSALTEGVKDARLLHSVFTQGAAWQRQQYGSRESVEIAARAIHRNTRPYDDWDAIPNETRDHYRRSARRALEAVRDA